MAKAQKHGNREAKKPKQHKPKDAPVASPFAIMRAKANPSSRQGRGQK